MLYESHVLGGGAIFKTRTTPRTYRDQYDQ